MLLSILIPSLVNRDVALKDLLRQISAQRTAEFMPITEVVVIVDNKELSTGAKRNALLQQAKGEYIVFIDDDDYIYPGYFAEIIKGCKTGADCLSIKGIITTDGRNRINWMISKDFKDETVKKFGRPYYLRHTNHIAPVKREIALQCGFPDKSNAEDSEYSRRLKESGLLKTEYKIDLLMYHYRYSTKNKEYK